MARRGARYGQAPGAKLVNTAIWEVNGTHMVAASPSGVGPGQAAQIVRPDEADRVASDNQYAAPGSLIWLRGGPGQRVITRLAMAHLLAGLVLAVAGLLMWYFAAPGAWQLVALAGAGTLVALAGAAGLWLARGGHSSQLASRAALPTGELLAVGVALWTLGQITGIVALLILPVALATVLLGWRAGAGAVAGSVLVAGVGALASGNAVASTGLLAGVLAIGLAGGLVVAALHAHMGQMESTLASLLGRIRQLEREQGERAAEQQHLLNGLHLLEETHRRLERERAELDRQVSELAHIVQRAAEGDLGAAHSLQGSAIRAAPGSAALAGLAAGIERLAHQLTLAATSQPQGTSTQRLAEGLAGTVWEQGRLLRATDAALRDQSAAANQLVAELQLLAQGRDEHVGHGPGAGVETLRGLEQLALGHASSTAMLGARMAQLRARQDQIESQLRRLAGMPTSSRPVGSEALKGASGVFILDAETPSRVQRVTTTPPPAQA